MENPFLDSDLSPSIKRTWSWRHREGASVSAVGDNLELLSLQEVQNENFVGLSSQEGYKRLFEVIREELRLFSHAGRGGWHKDFWTTLHCNHHSSVSWITVLFFVLEVFALFFTYGNLSTQRSSHLVIEGFIILIISLINVILCVREENLRRTEIYKSTKYILDNCGDYCSWNPSDYVDPCTPSSPSLSLVNTYRDGKLISIPCNLLVHGDVIVLGPSHTAPANVQLLSNSSEGIMEEPLVLEMGEMYKPEEPKTKYDSHDEHESTRPCQTVPRRLFVVNKAPFKSTLNQLLKSSSTKPVSLLENEKYFIATTVVEKKLLWIIFSLSLIFNIIRLSLLSNTGGHWTEMVFLLQAYVILPLLPLSFPLLWISVNLYGASRIRILFEKLKEGAITNIKVDKDFPVGDVLPQFWNTFAGDSSHLPRTANLLQVLGNVTVWCCVDRDGILSLPNPSVEKVFFLQSKKSTRQLYNNRFRDRKISSCTWESDISRQTSREDSNHDEMSLSSSSDDDDDDVLSEDGTHLKGRAAVLNISADPDSQFGLRFDDKSWLEYLNSLKPLGLNILLNSSCSCPVRGMRFTDYTAFLSLTRNLTPVHTPQRCLCLLGKAIGFTDTALNLFTKEQHIFVVHPLEFPIANFPVLQSSSYLAVCKERPVPCMTCLVVKDYHSGSHQLLTQGSPDLVLDACSDFWDGSFLNIITAHDKKKVLDFYQRNSISSQVIAFAYRPCTEVSLTNPDVFLKLPSIYHWKSSESVAESITDTPVEDQRQEGITLSPKTSSVDELKVEQLLDQVEPIEDAQPHNKLLGNQVFIGMVTLQYQAKKNIIPFVEDLNTAGIRFVHFSSEDELKSRGFAERMGLETGWNCHISLAETTTARERSKTESSSNPPGSGDGDDDDNLHDDVMHGSSDKHVCWFDVKTMEHSEKVSNAGTSCISETDEHGKTETSNLLGEEQEKKDNNDYWFFHNRAKLPRGVHNIRPHLENVDNVPLLVPLFTDCNPSAIQEMITIMQEHGEVVCCVGSSFNVNNTSIFTQADLSVSIEPMFPQLCLSGLPKDFRSGTPQLQTSEKNHGADNYSQSSSSSSDTDNELSPLELSALLNSLPCSLSFCRDTDFKFKSLLKEARRLSFGLRKCFTFILTCQLMLTVVMFLCQFLLLPPPLTGLHLLWLSCITVPLISLSVIGSKPSKGLMSLMTGRNDRTFGDIAYPFCLYFCLGFLPTCLFICGILFPLNLYGFCRKRLVNCTYLFERRETNIPWNGYGGSNVQVVSLAQDINAFTLVMFFAVVSTSFVHHLKPLWKRSPFTNRHWLYCVIIVIGLQLIYFTISQSIWVSGYGANHTIKDVPLPVIILVLVWPLVSLLVTELLKRRYIKLFVRFQKRAKLKFGTKLGMNSPF